MGKQQLLRLLAGFVRVYNTRTALSLLPIYVHVGLSLSTCLNNFAFPSASKSAVMVATYHAGIPATAPKACRAYGTILRHVSQRPVSHLHNEVLSVATATASLAAKSAMLAANALHVLMRLCSWRQIRGAQTLRSEGLEDNRTESLTA